MEYLFILGKTPLLSQVELRSVFKREEIVEEHDEFVRVKTSKTVDQSFFDRLGGVTKACEIIHEDIGEYLIQVGQEHKGKMAFGISVLGTSHPNPKTHLLAAKRKLKEAKISARFINKDFQNLTSVQIWNEKLIESRTDITIIKTGGKSYAGVTVAIQDYEAYSHRDYDKPFRDAKMGMLPPKLAQMMLSIANRKVIYDPFCGSGTILMEALLSGAQVIGSDISETCVHGTQANIDWLTNEFQLAKKNREHANVTLFVHDASKPLPLKEHFSIVTEGYLGPPQHTPPPPPIQQRIFGDIHMIYQKFFQNAAKVMKSGSRICITFPFFEPRRPVGYPFSSEYESYGFRRIKLSDKPLLYSRADQIVGREIVLYERI